MALVNGPLFSLEASGKLGNAIVYSKWKGRAYVREYVIPANPRTLPQVLQRGNLATVSAWWAGLLGSTLDRTSWDEPADARSLSPFNAMVGENLDRIREGDTPIGRYPTGGAPADGEVTGLTGTPLGGGTVRLAITLSPQAETTDLVGVMIGTPGGANTTAIDYRRLLAGRSNLDGEGSVTIDVHNIPPGTYFFAATAFGTDGTNNGEFPTAAAVVVT